MFPCSTYRYTPDRHRQWGWWIVNYRRGILPTILVSCAQNQVVVRAPEPVSHSMRTSAGVRRTSDRGRALTMNLDLNRSFLAGLTFGCFGFVVQFGLHVVLDAANVWVLTVLAVALADTFSKRVIRERRELRAMGRAADAFFERKRSEWYP